MAHVCYVTRNLVQLGVEVLPYRNSVIKIFGVNRVDGECKCIAKVLSFLISVACNIFRDPLTFFDHFFRKTKWEAVSANIFFIANRSHLLHSIPHHFAHGLLSSCSPFQHANDYLVFILRILDIFKGI